MAFNSEKGKSLVTSRTFWGVVIMIASVFSDDLGIKLGDMVENIITVLGGVFAMFGRYTATKQITGIVVPEKTDLPLEK